MPKKQDPEKIIRYADMLSAMGTEIGRAHFFILGLDNARIFR